MKFNDKYIHLPPFLSTSWTNVTAIYYKNETLFVHLQDGHVIGIHNLPEELMSAIFVAHAGYLEKAHQPRRPEVDLNRVPSLQALMNPDALNNAPEAQFKIGFGGLDGLGSALQHNPSQSNAPDLPKEMLSRIASITKIIAPDDTNALPKGEPHCNCFYCQITRAIHQGAISIETQPEVQEVQVEEEIVKDEELQFSEWNVQQSGDQLFNVTNRLDSNETYTVFLGHPVGCTCGKQGCEHMIAVLKS